MGARRRGAPDVVRDRRRRPPRPGPDGPAGHHPRMPDGPRTPPPQRHLTPSIHVCDKSFVRCAAHFRCRKRGWTGGQAAGRTTFDQGSADESGALGDVLPRVFVDAATDVLEFVAPLGVVGAFGRASNGRGGRRPPPRRRPPRRGSRRGRSAGRPCGGSPGFCGRGRPASRTSCRNRRSSIVCPPESTSNSSTWRHPHRPDPRSVSRRSASTAGDDRPSRTALSIAASIRRVCARAWARSMTVRVADIVRKPSTTTKSIGLQSCGRVHGEGQ